MSQTSTTVTVNLPTAFYADHVSRDLAGGTIVKETKRAVTVTLTAAEWSELRSDAAHYSDAKQFPKELHGICTSARATVKALDKAGRPAEPAAEKPKAARKVAARKLTKKDGSRAATAKTKVDRMRNGGASWVTIGNALDVSPSTARRIYDEVHGKGAHHGILDGKGGRIAEGADADFGGSGDRYGVPGTFRIVADVLGD